MSIGDQGQDGAGAAPEEPVAPPEEPASAPPQEGEPERQHWTRAEALGLLSGTLTAAGMQIGQAIGDRIRGPQPPDRAAPVPGNILCVGCSDGLMALRRDTLILRQHLEAQPEHDPWPLGLAMALDVLDQSLSDVSTGMRHLHAIQGTAAGSADTVPEPPTA
ncbi:MAG: hypothetical protein ABSH07_12045 [Candidatus Dormibacteria bacterium]|jgi:hypothetical protein